MSLPAAKEGDRILATDIHIQMVPSPGGPIPTPLPSPFVGTIDGGLSSDVHIEGKAAAAFVTRAQAESALFAAGIKPGNIRLSPLSLPGVPDTGWTVGMAIKAEHKELGLALEGALSQLRSSGELLAIFQKHGLTLTAP